MLPALRSGLKKNKRISQIWIGRGEREGMKDSFVESSNARQPLIVPFLFAGHRILLSQDQFQHLLVIRQ